MLRTGASRLALRSVPAPAARPLASFRFPAPTAQRPTRFSSVASKRPQISQLAQFKPIQASVIRRALTEERKQAENRYAHEKLKPTPETVSTTSSIHPIMSEVGAEQPEREVDMAAGIKSDVVCSSRKYSWSLADQVRKPFAKLSVYPKCLARRTTLVSPESFHTLQLRYQRSCARTRSTMP